ncbi:uncharacterized protein BcabD6B2_07490 [Babesia caballi]|uniref:Transmembrane protein n=1 Tax=Babesia caballi TaxID=5871 RepID=A0AAV4LMV8_BABCB|nr:transmembrane protein [Babesia caballi]
MAGMGTDTSSAAQYAQPDASESKHNLNNLDFNAQVEHILSQHAAIAADIRERDNIRRDKTAHPLAQIKITARIDARIQQVREDMEVLNTIYDRIKSAKRHRKKHTEEELQKFEDTIRNLEEHCNTYDSNKYRRMKTVKRRVQLDLSAPEGEETRRWSASGGHACAATEEDQLRASDSIKRWHTRDVHFDQQLQEIGEAVERIGELRVSRRPTLRRGGRRRHWRALQRAGEERHQHHAQGPGDDVRCHGRIASDQDPHKKAEDG